MWVSVAVDEAFRLWCPEARGFPAQKSAIVEDDDKSIVAARTEGQIEPIARAAANREQAIGRVFAEIDAQERSGASIEFSRNVEFHNLPRLKHLSPARGLTRWRQHCLILRRSPMRLERRAALPEADRGGAMGVVFDADR